MNHICIQSYSAPCGDLLLGSYAGKLCLCDWVGRERRERVDHRLQRILRVKFDASPSPVIDLAAGQLGEYFAGRRTKFNVPLLFVGTEFQKLVWRELLRIPYGWTVSYTQLAAKIGRPTSVRALANANAANALSIFAPCHRVIAADNSKGGYAGGVEAKSFLLALEQTNLAPRLF